MTFPSASNSDDFIRVLKIALAGPEGRDFATKLRDDLFTVLHRNVDNFSAITQPNSRFLLLKGGVELSHVSGIVAQTYAALVRDEFPWVDDAEEERLANQFGLLFTNGLVEGMHAARTGNEALRSEGWIPGGLK